VRVLADGVDLGAGVGPAQVFLWLLVDVCHGVLSLSLG
jgi:hypothetical protein